MRFHLASLGGQDYYALAPCEAGYPECDADHFELTALEPAPPRLDGIVMPSGLTRPYPQSDAES